MGFGDLFGDFEIYLGIGDLVGILGFSCNFEI